MTDAPSRPARVRLVPYTDADLWLTEALETDPTAMAELGGPASLEDVRRIHRRRLELMEKGDAWNFKVVPEGGPGKRGEAPPVGSIIMWRSEWRGTPVTEAGWMILPAHQGNGYATAALQLLLDRARVDGRWGDIHAFPGVTNAASNALCRKFGFELVEVAEDDYRGHRMRFNHWVLRAPR